MIYCWFSAQRSAQPNLETQMELGWGGCCGENGQVGVLVVRMGMQEVEMGQGMLGGRDEHPCLGGR